MPSHSLLVDECAPHPVFAQRSSFPPDFDDCAMSSSDAESDAEGRANLAQRNHVRDESSEASVDETWTWEDLESVIAKTVNDNIADALEFHESVNRANFQQIVHAVEDLEFKVDNLKLTATLQRLEAKVDALEARKTAAIPVDTPTCQAQAPVVSDKSVVVDTVMGAALLAERAQTLFDSEAKLVKAVEDCLFRQVATDPKRSFLIPQQAKCPSLRSIYSLHCNQPANMSALELAFLDAFDTLPNATLDLIERVCSRQRTPKIAEYLRKEYPLKDEDYEHAVEDADNDETSDMPPLVSMADIVAAAMHRNVALDCIDMPTLEMDSDSDDDDNDVMPAPIPVYPMHLRHAVPAPCYYGCSTTIAFRDHSHSISSFQRATAISTSTTDFAIGVEAEKRESLPAEWMEHWRETLHEGAVGVLFDDVQEESELERIE